MLQDNRQHTRRQFDIVLLRDVGMLELGHQMELLHRTAFAAPARFGDFFHGNHAADFTIQQQALGDER